MTWSTWFLARERLREVLDAHQSLWELERVAVGMATVGYSHEEIAARLERSVRSVDNGLQRARGKLAA